MTTEAQSKADFKTILRYGQCWEDADILLAGLDIQPGDHCLSIGSAGDNAIAMLIKDPALVVAVDLNPTQLAAIRLRIAAYKRLTHPELLELLGSSLSQQRLTLLDRCTNALPDEDRAFWHANRAAVEKFGAAGVGKFERYFRLFKRFILPLIHSQNDIQTLFILREKSERKLFYDEWWNTWRWRLLFRFFFSRKVMGALGRDPALFAYVQGSVADKILQRTRHALVELDPSSNPYLQWILLERHQSALPLALRPEHFETIRGRIDRLRLVCGSLESVITSASGETSTDATRFSRFNLSDIFEYMSEENYRALMTRLLNAATPGARFAYWNMLVPRSCTAALAGRLRPVQPLASDLFQQDKAFFYSRFVVEEAVP